MAYKFNPFTGNLDDVGASAAAFEVLGTVATVGDLPGGATQGDVYLVEADDNFYVWDGSAWSSLGTLAGPQGPTGATGAVGSAGADGADGADGVGVDAGGTTGQVLAKASNTDYDTEWVDQTGGGGTPGGSDTQVQFNDGGAFGGDSGLTYNDTAGALTVGGKTTTTDSPVLNLSQTWDNAATTFTGLKLNVTNTASAAGSKLLDLQVGGTSAVQVTDNKIQYSSSVVALYTGTGAGGSVDIAGVGSLDTVPLRVFYNLITIANRAKVGFTTGTSINTGVDVALSRDSAGVLAITDGSTGTGYLKLIPTTVGALTAAATVGAGTKAFVTDATNTLASHHGDVVAGGGSNFTPVYSDGTDWRIG